LLPQAGLFVYDSGAPNVLAKAGSAICASALGNHTSILRRARFFGTHAPRDKENQPKMPERKHAGDHPMLFLRASALGNALPDSNCLED
jgi:hypothetical protein